MRLIECWTWVSRRMWKKIFEYIRGTARPQTNGVSPPSPVSHPSPQCLLFSATFPSWVKRVAGKYLNPAFTLVDLVKNLTNKTASSVRHYAVFCPYMNRTSILADISKFYNIKPFSFMLRRHFWENNCVYSDQSRSK